jgi:hypothetical protein
LNLNNEEGFRNEKTCQNLAGFLISSNLFLQRGYVDSLQSLRAFFDGEFHLLALFETTIAIALDSGVMYKDICSIFLAQETVPLTAIEPFDCSDDPFRHCISLHIEKRI